MTSHDPQLDNLPVLDDKAIARLRQDMGADADLVIESYIESIVELLELIDQRDESTLESDLHRWAHTIKSSANGIGALRLAHMAASVEEAFRDRIEIDLRLSLAQMRDEYRQVTELCRGPGCD